MRLQNRVNYNIESQSKQTKFTSLRLTIHMSKLLINNVIKIYMFEINKDHLSDADFERMFL